MSDAQARPAPRTRRLVGTDTTFVVFSVDRVRYALPVGVVRRTLPYPLVTRLPVMPRHALGAFQHAGRVVALWDLHALFAAGSEPPITPWVVLTEHEGSLLGLAVGQVDDVLSIQEARLDASPSGPQAARPAVKGLLLPPDPQEAEPAPAADEGLEAMLGARPERGVEQLAALHPVHVLDLAALRRLGGEEVDA